ncbi:MAG: hypothetical protein HDR21_12070 [Lachnospiraceae bacterium]|nr:hypothetical protein [Lachnospiraceae bacterium]
MATLNLSVEGQLLTILNKDVIASGDVNVDRCQFTFSKEWEGHVKTAVFYQNKEKSCYAILEENDGCMIPAEAMERAGNMYIGVFGINGSKILTSTLEKIYIEEGAISGSEIDTEPSDDIFLSIIARYQAILTAITEQNKKFEHASNILEEQTEFLKKLNAFEIEPLEHRMSAMEIQLSGYGNIIIEEHEKLDAALKAVEESAFLIKDVAVTFENQEYRLDDERVTESSIVNAYFDAISVESALGHAIYVQSFEGYILFTTTTDFHEELRCTVEVRRY